MLYSLHCETFDKATTGPDSISNDRKGNISHDMFLEYIKYELLVNSNPDVVPLSIILKMFMLSGIKD
jgi:hypothetical protein